MIAGLVDNGGRVVAGLSEQSASHISAVGAASVTTASLVNAVLRSSAGVTVDAIVRSLDGVASDELLVRIISSADRNRDGIISQMEIDALRLSEGLSHLGSGLSIDIFRALDGNADSIISAEEVSRAAILAANSAATSAISSSVAQSGTVTASALRSSLAGKASDDVLRAVILAVDANGDGLITAQEAAAARTVLGISAASLSQIQSEITSTNRVANTIAQQSNLIASLTALQIAAIDANGNGIISAQEVQTASILGAYQSTVTALTSAIDRNGSMTTEQIRASLAGKASDAAINAVISAVDRNKDGIITAEESAAAQTLSGLSSGVAAQLQALSSQSAVFGNAITGQTGSITNAQEQTNLELGDVQNLQGETVSLTALVERSVTGNQALTETLLDRLTSGISVSGVSTMVGNLTYSTELLARIVRAQEAQLAAATAEAARQQAMAHAQAKLDALNAQAQPFVDAIAAASNQLAEVQNALSAAPAQVAYEHVIQTGRGEGWTQTRFKDNPDIAEWQGQINSLQSQIYAAQLQLDPLRSSYASLGAVPQFATGGRHTGGLRIVGENGPELEYTGPSQIVNSRRTQDLLNNDLLVAEVRALREEVARLRVENNSGHKNTEREVTRGTSPLREMQGTGSLPVKVIS